MKFLLLQLTSYDLEICCVYSRLQGSKLLFLSLYSGPDQEDYKIQYKRHCIIIEELVEAGAQDDDLAQPLLPNIPDKCAQVNILFLIILILIRSAEMVQLRIARTRITAMIGVRRHRCKKTHIS